MQGEGAQSGRAAVFCRFTGCNLWSGRDQDRAAAACRFCDTDFVGSDGPSGGRFESAATLVDAILAAWGLGRDHRLVVLTGGEPLLQVDAVLITALKAARFSIALETNGTRLPPDGIDWVCVSPKSTHDWVLTTGTELKLAYPQPELMPDGLECLRFDHFFLQPIDGPEREANTAAAIRYCLNHPRWRLSLQMHKFTGIP
ncbi:7-carboxy-7-deazaguanine synthase [uncultured Gammaproteobacteria bacterium]